MSDGPDFIDFTMPERCGASTANDIVAAGLNLAPGGRICVEAGGVLRMSCATVVALISLAQTAARTGGTVSIRSPGNAFTDAFADLGLYGSLMTMEFAE